LKRGKKEDSKAIIVLKREVSEAKSRIEEIEKERVVIKAQLQEALEYDDQEKNEIEFYLD
jgi:hypothetical protein